MSELVLHPQDEAFSFGEMLEEIRERTADFVGRLAARAGFTDLEDDGAEVAADADPETVTSKVVTPFIESHIVYAEEDEQKKKKPQRPQRPQREPVTTHDPTKCTLTVCSACNKLGRPK